MGGEIQPHDPENPGPTDDFDYSTRFSIEGIGCPDNYGCMVDDFLPTQGKPYNMLSLAGGAGEQVREGEQVGRMSQRTNIANTKRFQFLGAQRENFSGST